jgi:hypothetical protein
VSILIRDHKIYEQVFYDNEAHYEDIAKKQLSEIFGDFKPDLALIDRRYRMWAVVEVELEHHSLDHHVFPQMKALSSGEYGGLHADYLAQTRSDIDPGRMKDLVAYVPPEIMLLVNSRTVLGKGWGVLESELQVRLTFLEVYRAPSGDAIFNLSGYAPHIRPERIAGAKKHRMMNALVCANPNLIPVPDEGIIRMYYEGRPIHWQVVATADSALLIPRPTITLRVDRNYEILRNEDGRLVLRLL